MILCPYLYTYVYTHTESIRRYLGKPHKKNLSFNQTYQALYEAGKVLIILRNHGEMKVLGIRQSPALDATCILVFPQTAGPCWPSVPRSLSILSDCQPLTGVLTQTPHSQSPDSVNHSCPEMLVVSPGFVNLT